MVYFHILGMTIAVDFTAPALLALLLLVLPPHAVMQTAAAGLLHEAAHLTAIAVIRRKPLSLRISAAGLQLTAADTAVMPLRTFAVILLAGPFANLLCAGGFLAAGMQGTAAANLSLCLFNLLPCRSTDGGTLLYAALEQRFLPHSPEMPRWILRALCTAAIALISLWMYVNSLRNLSLSAMLIYLLLAEYLTE